MKNKAISLILLTTALYSLNALADSDARYCKGKLNSDHDVNAVVFNCGESVSGTLSQLAKNGWIVGSIGSANDNGTASNGDGHLLGMVIRK